MDAQSETILFVVSCIETRYPRLEFTLRTMDIDIVEKIKQNQMIDIIVRMTRSASNELWNNGYHVSEV